MSRFPLRPVFDAVPTSGVTRAFGQADPFLPAVAMKFARSRFGVSNPAIRFGWRGSAERGCPIRGTIGHEKRLAAHVMFDIASTAIPIGKASAYVE